MFADVLEHLRDPARDLRTASAYLKEGGRILFSIPNIAHADIIAKLLQNRFDYTNIGLLDDTHIHFWGIENLTELCESAGLTLCQLDATYAKPGETEQTARLNANLERVMAEYPYHNVYQIVCMAYKSDFALQNGIKFESFLNTEANCGMKYYIDTGAGFSEESCVSVSEQNYGRCEMKIKLPENAKRLRIDFREESGYLVKNMRAGFGSKAVFPTEMHGVYLCDVGYLMLSDDPQFVFNCSGESEFNLTAELIYVAEPQICRQYINRLSEISGLKGKIDEATNKINTLDSNLEKTREELESLKAKLAALQAQNAALLKTNSELAHHVAGLEEANAALEATLEDFKALYKAEADKANSLEASLAHVQAMYNSVANAACWKMTKPLRVILDLIKKIIRKIPILHKLARGLKCLKQNGFRYTMRRIKDKLRHNKETKRVMPTEEELERQRQESFAFNVKFSVLVPLYNTNEKYLVEMIESVRAQTYSNWELCLADGSDGEHGYVEEVARRYCQMDERVKYHRLEKNRGISENTNECAGMATGDFLALLDHDDLYDPTALYENARAINETEADVLYSDEDHLSVGGMHVNPFYKPDFSPDLLRSQMYICHLLVIRRSLFESIGGFDSRFDGSQDYDLMLRLSEATDKIVHIPKVLYNWRECETSTASNPNAKPYAHTAGKNALDAHLKRKFGESAYAEDSDYTFVFDARFGGMEKNPLVSIIMPMKDKWELTENCIESILTKSTYKNYEILILDNRSEQAETFAWFERVQARDSRIRVIKADMEFNWSKLNNFGMYHASGEVYIFLNNDTLIITPDWIERLCENALRDDIGVVGPLLLYEDDTIQHAGVVVGFGGWADHVFKGMQPVHFGAPYVSPMVSRNALAVTGACMAISKKTVEKIGGFDERFIICGSDIEMCIRAYQSGLYNKYMATVRLYHLESKSRDSYIPEIDFKLSYEAYAPYRENIDPFYNINLDINSLIPLERVAEMNKMNFRNFLKRCPITAPICRAIKRAVMPPAEYNIPEVQPIGARRDSFDNGALRINLLTPSVDSKHVFGGISTAMKFFFELCSRLGCDARIITCDAAVIPESSVAPKEYEIVSSDAESNSQKQLVAFNDRYNKTIPVRKNDIFMATGWWTAYTISDVIAWQSKEYSIAPMPLIYMIQDYEPGFYPWSSRYMMADSTYKLKTPIFAVVNSKELHTFLNNNGYSFAKAWSFAPVLNDKIAEYLPKDGAPVEKKKQILVYGRPTTERNAFALLMAGLKLWREQYSESSEWQVLSAGEAHDDVDLGGGVSVRSCGKLSLEEYAKMMIDTYAGVSLMVSPHPSYPPLEMSTFGVKTITNTYANKEMASFNSNIVSLNSCSASDIAEALTKICTEYTGTGIPMADTEYAKGGAPFGTCAEELAAAIKELI
jgi:GT2 family glycosyltransferase/archaellum component FlaC